MKRTFSKKELQELGLPYECVGGEIASNRITSSSRWTTEHVLVFQLPEQRGTDQAYCVSYSTGTVNNPSEKPWKLHKFVNAELVVLTRKLADVWEPACPTSCVGEQWVIEFRSGTYFQSSESDRGGPIHTARKFTTRNEAEDVMNAAPWILFNGGMAKRVDNQPSE